MGQYSIATLVKLPFDRALRETRHALKEENPPLAEAARTVNARLRAVVASVQFTGMTDLPQPSSPAESSETDTAGVGQTKRAIR